MAIKKTAPAKKVSASAKKTAPKKIKTAPKAVSKTAPKKKKAVKKGDVYECDVCGLAVKVENACDCIDPCDLICCGSPMNAA